MRHFPVIPLWLDGAERVQCGLGVLLLALPDRNALSGICGLKRPPPPQTPAHLDSTRTPRQLVNRLGKHTDKHSQPHLDQLISKSIVLPTGKPAQQMTLWTHAVMHTQRLTFKRLSPDLKPTLTIYITKLEAAYSSPSLLLCIQLIPNIG